MAFSEKLALTQDQVVTLTLWGEARGEPIEGKIAVGSVIRNRLELGKWGHTFAEVCWAPWQFSTWRREGGKENYERLLGMADLLSAAGPGTEVTDPALRECGWVAMGITGRWIRDNTKEATHYMTTEMFQRKPPLWAKTARVSAVIGDHTFLREVK